MITVAQNFKPRKAGFNPNVHTDKAEITSVVGALAVNLYDTPCHKAYNASTGDTYDIVEFTIDGTYCWTFREKLNAFLNNKHLSNIKIFHGKDDRFRFRPYTITVMGTIRRLSTITVDNYIPSDN